MPETATDTTTIVFTAKAMEVIQKEFREVAHPDLMAFLRDNAERVAAEPDRIETEWAELRMKRLENCLAVLLTIIGNGGQVFANNDDDRVRLEANGRLYMGVLRDRNDEWSCHT